MLQNDLIALKAVPFSTVTFLIECHALLPLCVTATKDNNIISFNSNSNSTKNNMNNTHNALVVQFIEPINQVAIPWIHLCGVVILRK